MANELIKIQGGPDAAFAWADPNEDSLADGIGGGYGVIGYRGGRWSLHYRGNTVLFTRKEDGTPAPFIHCIILGQARHKSRSYYERYEEGSSDPPICASFDGVSPDAGVTKAQAPYCNGCPQNIMFLNAETGKKTTKCKEHKRLSVLLLPAETSRMFNGEPLLEPVFLRVPAASLQNLALMGQQATSMGLAYYTFVTRIGFDPNVPYPKMIFEAVQKLGKEQEPLIREMRQDPQNERIITGLTSRSQPQQIGQQPAQQQMLPAGGVVDTGFAQVAPQQSAPTTIDLQATVVAPAAPPKPVAPPANPAPSIDVGGFAPARVAGPTAVTQAAVANTVVDQGEPTTADADMEARIAALMMK